MRLDGERESDNVEDRRGGGGFRGGGGIPIGVAGGGLGTVALVLLALFFGVDPRVILGGGEEAPPQSQVTESRSAPAAGQDDGARHFVAQVLATTEDAWGDIFRRANRQYTPPNLVLFSGGTQSACGFAQTAVGPFYCPNDSKVYLDTAFFRDMERKLGAPGEFARAYVIAHEVGHHIQNLTGVLGEAAARQRRVSSREGNAIQVLVELQADCYAGVWAANARDAQGSLMEPGDVEEGLRAAQAIGDDTLQRQAQGRVVPEAFTHGSSAQRQEWLRRGLQSGDPAACDTFNSASIG